MTEPEANVEGQPVHDPVVDEVMKAAEAVETVEAAVEAAVKALQSAIQSAKDQHQRVTQKRNALIVEDAHPPLLLTTAQLGRKYKLSERQVRRIIEDADNPPPRRRGVNRRVG